MLRICSEQEYKKYVEYVYTIAVDQSKSGYPTYSDGIKTKELFLERSSKAFVRDNENILLFEYEGKVEGWIHYYYLAEDHYLSTVSFNIDVHTEEALQEFCAYAYKHFKGYDLFLGYSKDNKKAVNYLSAHGFECIEDDFNNTAFLDKYEPLKVYDDVTRITRDNYELFRVLHSKIEGDMYWNSDRIYEDIDNWVIFVKVYGGDTLGSVYYMIDDDGWYEIYGIDMKDNVYNANCFKALLVKALNTAKELDGKFMTFFCDKEGQDIVKELGFECVGEYVCFKKHID
ncbi:MAG: hypothetical protein IKM20_08125 [Erysipelotrichales bacterium]|nr:hypothetical protein [Erysipelotrichales bacterium]